MLRLVVAACLLACAPSAAAMSVAAPGPTHQLMPAQAWAMDVTVQLECQAVLLHPDVEPVLHVTLTAPPGIVATGQTAFPIDRQACATAQHMDVPARFDVVPGFEVPAEEPLDVVVLATLAGSEEKAATTVVLETAYVGRFNATVEAPHKMAGPQKQITYPVRIVNHANAITMFSFKLDGIEGDGQPVLPANLILNAAGGSKTEDIASFVFSTPFENGPNDEHAAMTISIHAESAKQGTPGETHTLDLTADTRGFYVPGPGLAAAAVAMALALARRRA